MPSNSPYIVFNEYDTDGINREYYISYRVNETQMVNLARSNYLESTTGLVNYSSVLSHGWRNDGRDERSTGLAVLVGVAQV